MGLEQIDPEYPAVRRELIERGIVVTEDQLRIVLDVLHIDDTATVAAVQIDRHTVTVIRKHTRREVIPGAGLNGRGRVVEHTTVKRERRPIIRDATQLDHLRTEHP